MCCVDERAGGFVLVEGTREDIVKEERVCRWVTGRWLGVMIGVRWLKRRYT